MNMFLITLKQVCILVGYILSGYFLCRKKIIGREAGKIISKLLIYIITPLYTFNTMGRSISAEKIADYIVIVAGGALAIAFFLLLSWLISRFYTKNIFEKNAYRYMFTFSNYGYFGYPLIGAIWGEETLATYMLFTLPITIVLNSYGYFMLTGSDTEKDRKAQKAEVLKRIFSVPFISVIAVLAFGLSPIELPQILFDIATPASNCYSALAMWLVGIALASYSLKELFLSWKPYLTGTIRLTLIPLTVGAVILLLRQLFPLDREVAIFIISFACLPPGMNVVVYPESVGKDGSFGAKACFISYIMALVTIPIWFYLLTMLP